MVSLRSRQLLFNLKMNGTARSAAFSPDGSDLLTMGVSVTFCAYIPWLDHSTGADHRSRAFQITPSVALSLSLFTSVCSQRSFRCTVLDSAGWCLMASAKPPSTPSMHLSFGWQCCVAPVCVVTTLPARSCSARRVCGVDLHVWPLSLQRAHQCRVQDGCDHDDRLCSHFSDPPSGALSASVSHMHSARAPKSTTRARLCHFAWAFTNTANVWDPIKTYTNSSYIN